MNLGNLVPWSLFNIASLKKWFRNKIYAKFPTFSYQNEKGQLKGRLKKQPWRKRLNCESLVFNSLMQKVP